MTGNILFTIMGRVWNPLTGNDGFNFNPCPQLNAPQGGVPRCGPPMTTTSFFLPQRCPYSSDADELILKTGNENML